jgi:hypothetical protein
MENSYEKARWMRKQPIIVQKYPNPSSRSAKSLYIISPTYPTYKSAQLSEFRPSQVNNTTHVSEGQIIPSLSLSKNATCFWSSLSFFWSFDHPVPGASKVGLAGATMVEELEEEEWCVSWVEWFRSRTFEWVVYISRFAVPGHVLSVEKG